MNLKEAALKVLSLIEGGSPDLIDACYDLKDLIEIEDKLPMSELNKDEINHFNAIDDGVFTADDDTKIVFNAKICGVDVAIEGSGFSALRLLQGLISSGVGLYNGTDPAP